MIDSWIDLERFANNGSPNQVSSVNSVSTPTHPKYCPKHFYAVRLESVQNIGYRYYGTHPTGAELEKYGVPIHPDCAKYLTPEILDQYTNSEASLICTPSAAPRTLFAMPQTENCHFIKLSYPMRLGRFASPLTPIKAESSVMISEYILEGMREVDAKFCWFREPGFVSADIFDGIGDIGQAVCIFRDLLPTSTSDMAENPKAIIPLFSVLCSESPSNVSELWTSSSTTVVDRIWDAVLCPIIDSMFQFIVEFGLIPEPHAQNILLVRSYVSPEKPNAVTVAWRDALSFKVIAKHPRVASSAITGERKIDEQEIATMELSCCLDGMFDEYILSPLIARVRGIGNDAHSLRERTRRHVREWLRVSNIDLPEHGWFHRDSAPIEPGQRLRPRFLNGRSGVR